MNDSDGMKADNTAIQAIDQSESVKEIQQALAEARKRLKAMPTTVNPSTARGPCSMLPNHCWV